MADQGVRVAVYGTDWCGFTRALRDRLEALGVPYTYHDLEADPDAERAVREVNGGKRKFPTVVVGEEVMNNPPPEVLEAALRRYGPPVKP